MNKRIKELETKIKEARDSYYSLNDKDKSKRISDDEYDELEAELKELDPDNPIFSEVGIDEDLSDRFEKVIHDIPMLSMEKVKTSEEFILWYDKKISHIGKGSKIMTVTPKIDGVSGELVYKNGKLVEASTRGDGVTGYSIPLMLHNPNIPKTINFLDELRIRGEFYLPKYYEDKDGNNDSLRNKCAGIIKRLEKSKDLNFLQFVAYSYYIPSKDKEIKPITKNSLLVSKYPNTVPIYTFEKKEDVTDFFYEDYLGSLRDKWIYETDGIVIQFIDDDVRKMLNTTKKVVNHDHFAVAFKPPAKGDETTITEIVLDVGRTGIIVPVGYCKPITVGGVEIRKFTLNNIDFVNRYNIAVGDKAEIIRSNDVIPKILKNIPTENSVFVKYDINNLKCPSCGKKLKKIGISLYCKNDFCRTKIIRSIKYWFDQNSIENFGVSSITKVLDDKLVEDIYSFYEKGEKGLNELFNSINLNPDTVKARKFVKTLNDSRKQTERSIIERFGISGIGSGNLDKLKVYSLKDLLVYKDPIYSKSDVAIEKSLNEWLNSSRLSSLLRLIEVLKNDIIVEDISSKTKEYKGIVVITGVFDIPRKDLEGELKKKGYNVGSTVNKDTTILLVGTDGIGTTKHKKALQLGILCISDPNELP